MERLKENREKLGMLMLDSFSGQGTKKAVVFRLQLFVY